MLYKYTIFKPHQDTDATIENNHLVATISGGVKTNWRGNILVLKCRPGLQCVDVDSKDIRLIERIVLRCRIFHFIYIAYTNVTVAKSVWKNLLHNNVLWASYGYAYMYSY